MELVTPATFKNVGKKPWAAGSESDQVVLIWVFLERMMCLSFHLWPCFCERFLHFFSPFLRIPDSTALQLNFDTQHDGLITCLTPGQLEYEIWYAE